MERWRNNISTKDKLRAIQAFLSGQIDLTTYTPPQSFTAFVFEDVVNITPCQKGASNFSLSPEEFVIWKEALREQDVLSEIIFVDCSTDEPVSLEEKPEPVTPQAYQPTETPKPAPVQSIKPKKEKQPESMKEESEVVMVAVPIKKTSGKLSEYGDTWDAKHNDIFYS